MEDESFANLEQLLIKKRKKIQIQIKDLWLQAGEIDEFLASAKEENE
ncbi:MULTISPECIES: hypothetical protein [unclassified Peribacillus]|nr:MULTISPECIES: hypothetical protein [unclassified Peribacillus]MBK5460193.1 hypothetical protein [Peribacillus sp. TH27]WMX56506.1 hypothetical protein RE409_04530 [Peribacillus sp. R9-11]